MTSAITIVCNGALTIGKCLEHHAPLFDRWIVVDGPSLPSRETSGDGRRLTGGLPYSTDRTVEIVREFSKRHPNVVLLTHPTPWPSKVAKFNSALRMLSPGVVWEIDSDEFWFPQDIERVSQRMLNEGYSDAEFFARHFWGDTNHHTPLKIGVWGNEPAWRRAFLFNSNNYFVSHEPPRMNRKETLLTRDDTLAMGVVLYHYGYVDRKQYEARERYYGLQPGQLTGEYDQWKKDGTGCPHQLTEFKGTHPTQLWPTA